MRRIQFPKNIGDDQWGEAFEQSWTYTPLGDVATVSYPLCILSPNTTSRKYCDDGNDQVATPHNVIWSYNQGLPVQVDSSRGNPTFDPAADFEYHPNLTLARIAHNNGVEDLYQDWCHPYDPDARIAKMKKGHVHMAHKAEHAVDMDTGAVVAVTIQAALRR